MTQRTSHGVVVLQPRLQRPQPQDVMVLRPVLTRLSPFASLTAVFRRAFMAGMPVIIHDFEALQPMLGVLNRMAERLILTIGAHVGSGWCSMTHMMSASYAMRQLQYPPALSSKNRNILGHLNAARVMFVGDQINPVYRQFNHWPFHADRGCTVYLARCLDSFDFSEELAMWTNINCPEQHIKQVLEMKPLKVIALGKEATRGLKRLGVSVHAELPHPQYASRFLRNKISYAADLKAAIER